MHNGNKNDIAALYVDSLRGPYPRIDGVDCWDEDRNALLFPGGMPVIAHPPCGPWSRMRKFVTKQQAYKPLATVAVAQVLAYGGVLEHPSSSLWRACKLPKPHKTIPKSEGGIWALEIDQCRFGHQAQKKTWLLFCGITPDDLPPLPSFRQHTHCVGRSKLNKKNLKDLPKSKRHLTPIDFAEWLIAAVRTSKSNAS